MWLIHPELGFAQSGDPRALSGLSQEHMGWYKEEKSGLSSLCPVVPAKCFLPRVLPGK